MKRPDAITRRWIKNASDEKAAAQGFQFDEAQGEFVVEWLQRYLRLYEGHMAGQQFMLMDWQRDFVMRLFSWQRHSPAFGRPVRRFRQASVWVAKKNGKSPLLAALGLYLLCGDGEPGNNVYFGAADGSQARDIAGKHALEMAHASEAIMSECTINRSLCQITHEPSRSRLRPISSADERSQRSKEGLNGSILCDETHVLNRAFMNRVSRAGISRSEPLLIEVSTAGNDPESYGAERFEYGRQVEAGEVDDPSLLYISYAAPQDLSDADLAADPLEYGRKANPAMDHTVQPDEFMADYQRSRTTPTALAEFKMYRLNIWQRTATPWLSMTHWQAAARDYTAADLAGQECFAGLDLAKSRDTTALVLIFPQDDGAYKQLPFFWLPQDRADELRDKVAFHNWQASGEIELTAGDETDFEFVRARINELREQFDLRGIAYDSVYAAQLMQRLRDEDGMDADQQHPVAQTMLNLTAATVAYENLLIAGKLLHTGNRCLSWQAGNVRIKSDHNENKRPVKQKHGDYRTIDGIVAAIMALGLAKTHEPQDSVYDHRGVIVF